jgi:DNA modification methylase
MVEPFYSHAGMTVYHSPTLPAMRSLPTTSVDLIATSPPYNCRKPYADGVGDEMPWPAYYAWIGEVLNECYRLLVPGGILAVNVPSVIRYQHDHEHAETWSDFDRDYKSHRDGTPVQGRGRVEPLGYKLYSMMAERDPHIREPIVWVKGKAPGDEIATRHQMGSDNNPYMRPCHELILLGSKERWYHRGGTGRRGAEALPYASYAKDVWYIPSTSHPDHPAPWPIAIPDRLIKLFVHAADAVILDPFMGIGTTLNAAKHLGYEAIGVDASEKYCRITTDSLRQDYLFRV